MPANNKDYMKAYMRKYREEHPYEKKPRPEPLQDEFHRRAREATKRYKAKKKAGIPTHKGPKYFDEKHVKAREYMREYMKRKKACQRKDN